MFLSSKKGITLVETIIYSTLLLVVMFVVVNVVISLVSSHRKIMVDRVLEYNAVVLMDRVAREIRDADSVNLGLSVLNNNNGVLVLNASEGGVNHSVRFDLSGDILRFTDSENNLTNLSSDSVNIRKLSFSHFSNQNSEGVKVYMELEAGYQNDIKTMEVDNFIILRGSY